MGGAPYLAHILAPMVTCRSPCLWCSLYVDAMVSIPPSGPMLVRLTDTLDNQAANTHYLSGKLSEPARTDWVTTRRRGTHRGEED